MYRVTHALAVCVLACCTLPGCATLGTGRTPPAEPAAITHGVASGDVTDSTAIVWARADRDARLRVEYSTRADLDGAREVRGSRASARTDFTATARLEGLAPATRYYFRAHFGDGQRGDARDGGGGNRDEVRDPGTSGSFKTAQRHNDDDAVTFAFGGDLGGQELCRRPDVGYDVFAAMLAIVPDFFIANGDMIYADGRCPERPTWLERLPEDSPVKSWRNVDGGFGRVHDADLAWTSYDATFAVLAAHWRYNRDDPHHRRFLAHVPVYGQWDDHEVINDFGAGWSHWRASDRDRAGYSDLVRAGRDAFFAYTPIERHPDEPERIHRSFRRGRHLELFVVDARSYRSRNDVADTADAAKTMLGQRQLDWLVAAVAASDATWKVVSIDVPMSIPTGSKPAKYGRDGWASGPEIPATGFERELGVLLARLDALDVANLVFLTTDVHRAATIAYDLDADGDGDRLRFHELLTGPLNAGAAPAVTQDALDPTFSPRLLYSEGELFNFGVVQIGGDGSARLRYRVRDNDGRVRPGSSLVLDP